MNRKQLLELLNKTKAGESSNSAATNTVGPNFKLKRIFYKFKSQPNDYL